LEVVVLELQRVKLLELQDQFQHLELLHQLVVVALDQVLVQVLNQILVVKQVEVVVEELVDVVVPLLD
jgi:hypothetical protein